MLPVESYKKPTAELIVQHTGWGFLIRGPRQELTPPLDIQEEPEKPEQAPADAPVIEE